MTPTSLSGECGYCRSNNIRCDVGNGKAHCPTCRIWGIKCPLTDGICKDSGGHYLDNGCDEPRQISPTAVHYMRPLDNLISAVQLLLGSSIPFSSIISMLPLYVKDLPDSISPDDIQCLADNGVLTFPDPDLRNELLKAFVLNVYPYMPLLDLEAFLQAVAINNGESRVSLLLFHAVIFSSTAFIDPEHLYRAGYSSRKEARREFFRKATVLYDLGLETDPIVIIQAALLLTYWHETPDNPKDFHYWLEIALSRAKCIGLQNLSRPEFTKPSLWRRLWWCLYTRDRINAMNLHRRAIISEESYTTSLPALDDFTIKVFPKATTQMLDTCEVLRSPYHQSQLSTIFIEKARLCTVVAHIITPNPNPETLSCCRDLLEIWHADLPPDLQHQSPPPTTTLSDIEKPVFAYRAWLRLVFLNALSALHRHQTGLRRSHTPILSLESLLHDLSDRQIQSTMRSIATVAEELYQVDAIHYLPTTTVGLLLPVLTIHVLYIRSEKPDMWIAGFRSFYQCMKVLQKLGEVYFLAESMASFFESAICGDTSDDSGADADAGGCASGRVKATPPPLLEDVLTSTELDGFLRMVGVKQEI